MKQVTILGSTGSVGRSALNLISENRDKYEILALTANTDVEGLVEQSKYFKPKIAVITASELYHELKSKLSNTGIVVMAGSNALVAAASEPADLTFAAIVGAAGLLPTLTAIKNGKTVAIANKECLVCAGELFMQYVNKYNTTLLPVDSEHNAIFQVFDASRSEMVSRVILTASGGPFRNYSMDMLETVTQEQALAHPNWSMGPKISIDSATMMNKGFELIEAHYLFNVSPQKLEVLVHPESIVHSLVEYIDGSMLAQLSVPDMQIPLAYALAWPDRIKTSVKSLDLTKLSALHFENVDDQNFPSLNLARNAMQEGGTATTLLNAANEIAVEAFLLRKIKFLDIYKIVEYVFDECQRQSSLSLEVILDVDRTARELAQTWMRTNC